MDPGADARIVAIHMLLMGLGLGALSSQLGAITVSAVPDSQFAEVGGLQNTATNLGASLGVGGLTGSVCPDGPAGDHGTVLDRATSRGARRRAGSASGSGAPDVEAHLTSLERNER